MNSEISNTIILAGCFIFIFFLGEILFHFFKVKVEVTRKFVHIISGLLTLLFPIMLHNSWLVLLLCSSFAILLISSLAFGLLPSINSIHRKSYGSMLFPLSVYLCYLAFEFWGYQYHHFYIPILILAISDPLAAMFGTKWPIGRYAVGKEYKTYLGSFAFFISSLIICLVLYKSNASIFQLFIVCIAISLITTFAEAQSRKGFDNITVPISGSFVLYISEYFL